MADEALLEAVLDHPRVALIAGDLLAAGTADRDRRVSAAVQEQQRLFAAFAARRDLGRDESHVIEVIEVERLQIDGFGARLAERAQG